MTGPGRRSLFDDLPEDDDDPGDGVDYDQEPDTVTGVQTAGYKEIKYGGALGQCTRRWGLWLKNTGKYSLTEFKAGTDAVIFHSALAIANFKRRHSDERS